jgi:hypothetical protein
MKGELSGVDPVFAGVADPIGSGRFKTRARSFLLKKYVSHHDADPVWHSAFFCHTTYATATLSPSSEFKILLRFLDH